MTENNVKLGLNDISILPCIISDINSRSECIPYDEYGMLPLFTAPMNTVVDENNFKLFKDNNIIPIIPRTVDISKRLDLLDDGEWVAFGLEECVDLFLDDTLEEDEIKYNSKFLNYYYEEYENNTLKNRKFKILIDVANGHMKQLYSIHKQLKSKYNCLIMLGNIANPETYRFCCEQGVDYVRIGIGGGSVCITSSNTGIHYPMATLIEECYNISCTFNKPTKIVADGGMKNYSDIIKALGLGADYVMCGGLFAKMLETPGKVEHRWNGKDYLDESGLIGIPINQYEFDLKSLKEGEYLEKQFYGMASREGQKRLGLAKFKTSEGKVTTIRIGYTISGWVDNFISYLKSNMSYCGKRILREYIGNVKIIKLSYNSSISFNS